jgi:hypothetical protein
VGQAGLEQPGVDVIKSSDGITVHVRLRGGQHHTLNLALPLNAWQKRKTPETTIAVIDELLGEHTHRQIAAILTERDLTSGEGKPFTPTQVSAHCFTYHLRSLRQRLRDTGLLTLDEIATHLGAHPQSIKRWYRLGLITGGQPLS